MEVFGLGIRIQEEGTATVSAALKRLQAELQATAKIANGLGSTLGGLTGRTNAVSGAMRTAGATTAQGMGMMESSLRKVGAQFAATYLGTQAVINGLRQLVQTGDTMLMLEGRIGLVTDGMDNLRDVQDELFASAQRTRSSYASTAELFARVARNSDQLGYSQQTLLNFTELTQMSIRNSGINAIEASRGMIQLSQAMASGVLRGDEFRAVMEQMPGLSHAMAQGLNVTIGQLREMANTGQLTAQKVMDAILKMEASIRADFARLPVTVGDGMTRIGNSLSKAIEKINQSTDASQKLGKALSNIADFITNNLANAVIKLAENWNTLKAILTTLVGVFVATLLPQLLALQLSVTVLTGFVVTLAAKFTALWAAIAGLAGVAVITAFAAFAYIIKQADDIDDIYERLDKHEDENMRRAIERIRKEKAERDEAERKRKELTKEQIEALRKQIEQTIQYNSLLPVSQRNVNDLVKVEKALALEMSSGNIALERRIEVFQQLQDARQLLYEMGIEAERASKSIEMFGRALSGVVVTRVTGFQNFMANVREALTGLEAPEAKTISIGFSVEASRARLRMDFRAYADAVAAEAQRLKISMAEVIAKDLGAGISDGLLNGLAGGIQAAIMSGRISDLWKTMAQVFVGEISSMMAKVAMVYIQNAAFIKKIQATLISNPFAAIAAAAAMLAFAYANGGKAQGGSTTFAGGAGGLSTGMTAPALPTQQIIFGATSATTAAGMTPRQSMNVTVIGPNDPSAQRAIQELMTKANSRGRIG